MVMQLGPRVILTHQWGHDHLELSQPPLGVYLCLHLCKEHFLQPDINTSREAGKKKCDSQSGW